MVVRLTVLAAAALLAGGTATSAQQLLPEQIGITRLGDFQRVYVADPALPHMVDGRIYVLDAADMSLKGMLEAGFSGMLLAAPDKDRIYVASTFYERLTRGKRTDVIQVFDARTLKVVEEIPVSLKRALALPYRNLFQRSADGRTLLIQNATPATSVNIVDIATRRGLEVASPGCYGIYPAFANPLRFSTLCGDGTIATYTIAGNRRSAARKAGPKFFDPDADALFSHAERDTDAYVFLSYTGKLVRVSVEGETAQVLETADVVAGVDGKWGPGGYQPFALDPAAGVAYLLMHADRAEGSHKKESAEIWAYDLRGRKLIARSPAANLTSLTIAPQGNALFGINGADGKIARFDVDPQGRKVTAAGEIKLGETAALIEVPR